jgi:hypothetical protein
VIDSTENCFDIFTTGEETVSLKVVRDITNGNLRSAPWDIVESAHFNEVRRLGECTLRFVSVSLQGQLFFQETDNKANNTVGKRVVRARVGALASVLSNVSKRVIGGRKGELAEFLELKGGVVGWVVLTDDVWSIGELSADVVLAHKINKVIGVDATNWANINHVESFLNVELGIQSEVLSADFDLFTRF